MATEQGCVKQRFALKRLGLDVCKVEAHDHTDQPASGPTEEANNEEFDELAKNFAIKSRHFIQQETTGEYWIRAAADTTT